MLKKIAFCQKGKEGKDEEGESRHVGNSSRKIHLYQSIDITRRLLFKYSNRYQIINTMIGSWNEIFNQFYASSFFYYWDTVSNVGKCGVTQGKIGTSFAIFRMGVGQLFPSRTIAPNFKPNPASFFSIQYPRLKKVNQMNSYIYPQKINKKEKKKLLRLLSLSLFIPLRR